MGLYGVNAAVLRKSGVRGALNVIKRIGQRRGIVCSIVVAVVTERVGNGNWENMNARWDKRDRADWIALWL